jgi:adenine deaminase
MSRAILLVLTLSAGPWNRVSAQDAPLFIAHVAVVDVIAGRVQPDMTVEIRGRTIAAMTARGPVRILRGATVVDGRGEYLIPGLWDMHVHMSFPPGSAQIFLPLMVANGVLGARDMHSLLSIIVPLKHAVASGSQIGPRLFVAGPSCTNPDS